MLLNNRLFSLRFVRQLTAKFFWFRLKRLSHKYKDNDSSVDTISSVYSKCTYACRFKSQAWYSRMDSDWLLMFESFINWRKIILEVIPTISFLCAFIVIVVLWALLFFNIANDFYNYIFIWLSL